MKIKRWLYILIGLAIFSTIVFFTAEKFNLYNNFVVGQKIDSLNGVYVIYNGSVVHVEGRNTTEDGYNLGLKYQCVEFTKRYYFQYLNHKMPDSYGHAKDFFDHKLADGELNKKRNLMQYTNPSTLKPEVDDFLIFDKTNSNQFGHVAIVSIVTDKFIEIIQQNPGPFQKSRVEIPISYHDGKWKIKHKNTLGWLRKEHMSTSN